MPAKGMKPETQHSQSGLCTFFSTFKLNSALLTIMLTFSISKQSKCGRSSFLIRQGCWMAQLETLVLSFDSCAPQGHAPSQCHMPESESQIHRYNLVQRLGFWPKWVISNLLRKYFRCLESWPHFSGSTSIRVFDLYHYDEKSRSLLDLT